MWYEYFTTIFPFRVHALFKFRSVLTQEYFMRLSVYPSCILKTLYEAFKHFDMWKAHGTEGFLFTWGNFHKPSNIHVFRHFDLSCFCCQYSPIQINVSSSIKRKDAAYLGWEGRWVSSYRCFLCQSNLSKL